MADDASTRKRNLGCAAAIAVAIAAVVVGGVWLGQRDEAQKSPCERYAAAVIHGLKNCHSGQTKNYGHHMSVCKQRVNPTDACIQTIERLSCDALEMDPAGAAGEACEK